MLHNIFLALFVVFYTKIEQFENLFIKKMHFFDFFLSF